MENKTYEIEKTFLSPYACKSCDTKGRDRFEEENNFRTPFQRDRDRIIHSKAFRRLKNKTQVFLSPHGDHFRTRMTHTLDVAQIARTISRILNLNEDLTEAIALGHDLGHTPFGHAGERALDRLTGNFSHEKQGVRVVELLEKDGEGLNLTFEVRNGIENHNSSGNPKTLEGQVVHFADWIAYLNHDIDDASRAGMVSEKDIPKEISNVLGTNHSARINTMITSIYSASFDQNFVKMTDEVLQATQEFRRWMFKNVYLSEQKKHEEDKVDIMLEFLFEHYMNNIQTLPKFYVDMTAHSDKKTVVADYIALMTDNFALQEYKEIFLPIISF